MTDGSLFSARVRIAAGGDCVDVRGSFWWLRWRWQRAIKRHTFLRVRCVDGRVLWFNARQIVCMVEL